MEQEKQLFVEISNSSALENKLQELERELKEEANLFHDLDENKKYCEDNLVEGKELFNIEYAQLDNDLKEINQNYGKNNECKDALVTRQENCNKENQEQIKSKLAEIEKMKVEITEVKGNYNKMMQLVDETLQLKTNLEKQKASLQDEYNAKIAVKTYTGVSKKIPFQEVSSKISGNMQLQSTPIPTKPTPTVRIFFQLTKELIQTHF